MDLKSYNKLRIKISKKNFEGKNKLLDKWLYNATFFANAISIFFAFFLLYPALQGSFLVNIGDPMIANIAAGVFSVGFLVVFEVVKRYLIRNFSFDYIWRKLDDIVTKTWLWFSLVIIIIVTSFYLSVSGARNFATTFEYEREIEVADLTIQRDSIINIHNNRISSYEKEIRVLSDINISYRQRMSELPDDFLTARREFQQFIRENEETIKLNRNLIIEERNLMNETIEQLEKKHKTFLDERRVDDFRVILLFSIIVLLNESLIVLGLYFREYFEHKLYLMNKKTYESHYMRKKYYNKMLKFIYNNGLKGIGDPVGGLSELENQLMIKTNMDNPGRFISDFVSSLKRANIVVVSDRRDRYKFRVEYADAINILNNITDNIIEFDYDE